MKKKRNENKFFPLIFLIYFYFLRLSTLFYQKKWKNVCKYVIIGENEEEKI